MNKAATQDLVLNGIQALMHPGERLAGFVKVVAGPWQYLVYFFLATAASLALLATETGNFVPAMVAALLALLCVMRMRTYALVLTDTSLYLVRIQQGRVGAVDVIRPLFDVGFEGGSMRIVIEGSAFWVQPAYLGADAQEFERNLQAAAGVAVAF
jgi:uncharacterized membrane protein YcfT